MGRAHLMAEGKLDEHYDEMRELNDDDDVDGEEETFLEQVLGLFFSDAEPKLKSSDEPVDYKQIDEIMHQFKGSSASVGLAEVTNLTRDFREATKERNLELMRTLHPSILRAVTEVKEPLILLLKLEKEATMKNKRSRLE